MDKAELQAIRAKEQMNRERAIENSRIHDAAVMQGMKNSIGMGTPAPAPAPIPAPAPQGQGMKKGGKVMEHKHNVDHVKAHYGQGHKHQHEQDKVSKHKEGHKMHHEHVKAMSKGGKC